jgi:hypothetical protein
MLGLVGNGEAIAPSRLRIELPEVLRIHLLEVFLELVRLERGIGGGIVRLDAVLIEELVAGEDRREPEEAVGDDARAEGPCTPAAVRRRPALTPTTSAEAARY